VVFIDEPVIIEAATKAMMALRGRFFFSADISEISPKTGFIGDHRYSLIPNEIFQYS
jgi:hypothetical protein